MKDKLIEIFGRENVSDRKEDLLCYSFDASELEGHVDFVVWPCNAKQVSDLMKLACAKNVPVVPRGAGTNLSGGAIPLGGIVLDLSRMNSIVEFGENYVVCEPGVVLEDLEYFLNKRGKSFPVLPASDKACSVGGCISEDSAGMRAIKYGSMCKWVRELEVVLPDGRILDAGEKAFCGSEGTLGIITKAKLGIIDIPQVRTLSVYEFDDYGELQNKVVELSKQDVSAIEFVGEKANKLIERPIGQKNVLIVEFENEKGELKSRDEVRKLMEHRKTISTQLALNGYVYTSDPKIPLEKISEYLSSLDELNLPSYGHIGVGIIHARSKSKEELKKIFDKAVELGGSAVGEHGVGLLKKGMAKDWVESIKKDYDPKNVLNPGKVFGEGVDVKTSILESCRACGICRSRCPVFKQILSESVSPRGKCILHNRGVPSDVFYKCTLCRACEEVCPIGTKITDLIKESRSKLVASNKSTEANERMIENIRKYGNPFGKVEKDTIPKELYCC